jgi:hypothetical protein
VKRIISCYWTEAKFFSLFVLGYFFELCKVNQVVWVYTEAAPKFLRACDFFKQSLELIWVLQKGLNYVQSFPDHRKMFYQ